MPSRDFMGIAPLQGIQHTLTSQDLIQEQTGDWIQRGSKSLEGFHWHCPCQKVFSLHLLVLACY